MLETTGEHVGAFSPFNNDARKHRHLLDVDAYGNAGNMAPVRWTPGSTVSSGSCAEADPSAGERQEKAWQKIFHSAGKECGGRSVDVGAGQSHSGRCTAKNRNQKPHTMTKTKAEKRELMAQVVKEVLGGRQTGWPFMDSAKVTIRLLKELPDKSGKPTAITPEIEKRIEEIFDAKRMQLDALNKLIEDLNTKMDGTTRAQILQLLDTEEFRNKLVKAKLLTKQKRSKGKTLADLMDTADEEEEVTA
jgi:hypothetical protein